MISTYNISQIENNKKINYGNFKANNSKEAIKMACEIAKEKYPQYNYKIPFKVKEYGHKSQEVIYHE